MYMEIDQIISFMSNDERTQCVGNAAGPAKAWRWSPCWVWPAAARPDAFMARQDYDKRGR